MRISGGRKRGRKLASPGARHAFIRPTSDRVREAVFNILGERVLGANVLDVFAGTGSFGIEALSRGAQSAIFVDQSAQAGQLIITNLTSCFSRPNATFITARADTAAGCKRIYQQIPQGFSFDLLFMDPPYGKNLAEKALIQLDTLGLFAPGCVLILEEKDEATPLAIPPTWQNIDKRRYGTTGIWFYQRGHEQNP